MSDACYIFDTCAFSTPWKHTYPLEDFPQVWEVFSLLIQEGRLLVPREVSLELQRDKSPEGKSLVLWLRDAGVVPLQQDEAVLREMGEIAARFSARADWPNALVADPWVLAWAVVRNAIPVTLDGLDPVLHRINKEKHLAAICRDHGRPVIPPLEVYRRERGLLKQ